MWQQEKAHLSKFEQLMKEHGTKPTLLQPFWDIAGFALGAGTAAIGKEAAMACTVAVEEVIGQHYNKFVAYFSSICCISFIHFIVNFETLLKLHPKKLNSCRFANF